MGKVKKKDSKAASAPKCTCDHPFNCECGNRPPRPSKGHKWDPEAQAWGGKGHKQKGASGQTASVAQEAKVTEIGLTKLAQWQRLPSQILSEYCKQQKRPNPKYKNIEKKPDLYKYRVILPDPKDEKKDLFYVPNGAVENEEQAKEEACLLALLQLTPSLPHERKLPEPYRSTWLHAIESQKTDKKSGSRSSSSVDDSAKQTEGRDSSNKAKASTNLTMGSKFTSQAEREKAMIEKRRLQNERVRKHEAMRMANQDHQVFMSATIRKAIEQLLRGDRVVSTYDEGGEIEEPNTDSQMYIESRLHHEGFSHRQARQAFRATYKDRSNLSEEKWEEGYEECLQWLLVHLNEDDLPEGFDPRGGTLDIIVPEANGSSRVKDLAQKYGLFANDVSIILKSVVKDGGTFEDTLWGALSPKTRVIPINESLEESEANRLLEEELEALAAIFNDDFKTHRDRGLTTIEITLGEDRGCLIVQVKDGIYPSVCPNYAYIVNSKVAEGAGASLQKDIAEYSLALECNQPMIFEIHAYITDLLDKSYAPSSLFDKREVAKPAKVTPSSDQTTKSGRQKLVGSFRRPKEQSPFWSIYPSECPPADPNPSVPQSIASARAALPAADAKLEFLDKLRECELKDRVMLVTGETGCGKTTQIPQFILEKDPVNSKIVVCQPRRLAATGVAARVAEERGEGNPGQACIGYVVRGDSAISKSSRIVFCTTGVLLRQLQNDSALDCLSHIVVDEVHERQLDTDILLGLLKEILGAKPNLKVVLMSATLDAERFASYWGQNTPTMHIPGRTFPVTDLFLEDVLALTSYIPKKVKRKRDSSDQADESKDGREIDGIDVAELAECVDQENIDYDLLSRLVIEVVDKNVCGSDGSVLVFLPGSPEINKGIESLKRRSSGKPLHILPLHGGLQPKDQNLVFHKAPRGTTKVILSTNVAETSITIDDCTVVIDCGREKQSSFDPSNRMPLLLEKFCSKASLKQRRGRAGRVREGTCFKLISKKTFARLSDHSEPEIKRCALDQTLLSLVFLGVEKSSSGQFLQRLIDPPERESIASAIKSLQTLGALNCNGDSIHLTPLGVHLAAIPAHPTIGKIMILGCILGCREASIAMASSISVGRTPFLRVDGPRRRRAGEEVSTDELIREEKEKEIIEERKKLFSKVGNSDHAFLALIFMEWQNIGAGGGARKQFCERYGLSFNGMKDIAQLARQYDSALNSVGYSTSSDSDRNGSSWRIIRTCAVAAMSPGQLVKVVRPAMTYHETAEGAVEKEGKARELKFFVRSGSEGASSSDLLPTERVFVHPSSFNFGTGSFSCPWLVYNSLVRTSKPFLRDVTECTAYSLLLFGGTLSVEASKGTITIDDWCRLSANARIGSLVGGLRQKVDKVLEEKVRDPLLDVAATEEMKLIVKLIRTDGLGA